jgi:hypothetical protein
MEARDMSELDLIMVLRELADALRSRARQMEIADDSLRFPAPGVLVARTTHGELLRLDIGCYTSEELSR